MRNHYKIVIVLLILKIFGETSNLRGYAQESVIARVPTSVEQTYSGDFSLSSDHIALTITPKEVGVLNIEVLFQGDAKFPIRLEISECPISLKCDLSTNVVSCTQIVQLSISTKYTDEILTKYQIIIKATRAGKEHFLPVWVFVANPPPQKHIITLEVPPIQPLENGVIQPIEGRVVPQLSGNIALTFRNPDRSLFKIYEPIDSQGYFVHNRVFKVAGDWKAQATFENAKGKALYASEIIDFAIAKRRPRGTVTTVKPWEKTYGDFLEIKGQLVADEEDLSKMSVAISIHSPTRDTLIQTVPSNDGRFSGRYLVTDSTGYHRIEVTPLLSTSTNSTNTLGFKAFPSGNSHETDQEENYSNETATAEFDIGGTKDHVILLEGGNECNYSRGNTANLIEEILTEYRFIDSMLHLRTQDMNKEDCKEYCKNSINVFLNEISTEDSLIIRVS